MTDLEKLEQQRAEIDRQIARLKNPSVPEPDFWVLWRELHDETPGIAISKEWGGWSKAFQLFLIEFVSLLRARFAAEQPGENASDETVQRELAEAGIDMTEPNKKLRSMTMAYGALAFLKRLCGVQGKRGCIVSSADCSSAEIATAQASKRFFVDEDSMGYVLRPGEPNGRIVERVAEQPPASRAEFDVEEAAGRIMVEIGHHVTMPGAVCYRADMHQAIADILRECGKGEL